MKTRTVQKPRRSLKLDYLQEVIDSTVSRMKASREEALQAVKTLISYIGDDPNRPGLIKTPERVIRAWETDWGVGYNRDYTNYQKRSILDAQFDDGAENYDEMILVRGISFFSSCEHHLAIFEGTATIGYIPDKKILGLSKLSRIVEMYARRLQVQERLTSQVADFIDKNCKPLGVGVVIKARHFCMCSRGIKQPNTDAVTSSLRGEMLTQPEVRSEFLRLVGI
jgi:GTP cyclohydrolase I